MSLETNCLPNFAAHQTFHPRFGWLKKGIDSSLSNPSIFSSNDATIHLGVGKNMVDAIKFWSVAFKLIQGNSNEMTVTKFGEQFLSMSGFDPYLEDLSTLWVMHWKLMQETCHVPAWWLFFNKFGHATFSQKRLADALFSETLDSTFSRKPNKTSIEKDVDVILRMYSSKNLKGRQTVEDILDSPFRDLGLVIPNEVGEGSFRFVFGKKPSLSGFVVQYACLDYLLQNNLTANSISLSRLVTDENSPGRIFKIDSDVLRGYLEDFALPGVEVTTTAGSLQMTTSKDVTQLLANCLEKHYGTGKR